MKLPSEILELIVSQGLDSCETSISWMDISPIFQKVVNDLLGVIVLQDGVRDLKDTNIPFDYKRLMSEFNTLVVSTDYPIGEDLLEFTRKYMHLLIVIQSNRNYSDVLASLVVAITKACNKNTTVCVIYCNFQNYLSKLYFRGMSFCQENVVFSELHIIGNSQLNETELFDVDTLFQRTYLHHLKTVYSLDVRDKDHRVISRSLDAVNQLNFGSFDEKWDTYFIECPNLRKIENTKYPIRTNDEPFKLPKCESISLTHYVNGVHYQPIDGFQVTAELKLAPALRSQDPEFYNLHFANLKKLRLMLNESENHLIRFHDCHFDSLESLDCASALIPWNDLISSGAQLKHITLSLTTDEQAKWLSECPYQVTEISIVSYGGWSPVFPNISYFPLENINCRTVGLEIQSLWHCYLFQVLVLPNVGVITDLRITVKEESLLQSILDNYFPIEEWGINLQDDCIVLKIPFVNHLTITLTDRKKSSKGNSTLNLPISNATSGKPMTGYPNIFFDANATIQNYAVSPSEFRRSSLAGADSETARRRSSIVSLTSHSTHSDSMRNRRRSSASSSVDATSSIKTCKFAPVGVCPETITVNLATLDASIISWENIKTNRITLLQILIQDLNSEELYLHDSTRSLSEEIIRVLNYPYHLSLQGMTVEKFQIVVDLENSGFHVQRCQRDQFAIDLQRYLAFKGYNIIVSRQGEEDFRVSVLLKF